MIRSARSTWTSINTASRRRSRWTLLRRGCSEDIIRLISVQEERTEWMLEWRLEAYRRWQTMEEPTWARVPLPEDRSSTTSIITRRRRARTGPKSLDEVDPELVKVYEKLGIPLKNRKFSPASRSRNRRRCGVRFGLRRHHLQGRAEEGRRHLHVDLRGDAGASGPRAEVFSVRSCRSRITSMRR